MLPKTTKNNTHVIIPTLNEETTIRTVIDGFVNQGINTISVVDGGSTDDTQNEIKNTPAELFEQPNNGKGNAIQYILHEQKFNEEYIVFIDGDETYNPTHVERLLKPLIKNTSDEVLGNRFANLQPESMTTFNKIGNYIFNSLFVAANVPNCPIQFKDILTGYRAYNYEVLRKLQLKQSGFGIETELCTEITQNNYRSTSVPITYYPRPKNSEENLHPIKDGAVILRTIIQSRLQNI